MESLSVASLSPEDKNRMAYIEDRPDLFETKILHLKSNSEKVKENNILVVTRDPGSANALLPVVKELIQDPNLGVDFITDGRAQEIVQKSFLTENITPMNMTLGSDLVIGSPELVLMDRSSEMGIDTYVSATFPEVPKILVEDAYANTLHFLAELIERNLPLPKKICVLDKIAKEIIVKKFPQLESIIEVTGQPAFDRFVTEDTESIAKEVKGKLGLKFTDKLVSFMSVKDEVEKIQLLATALKEVQDDFYFVFRRHPRDNVRYETYKKILIETGIKVIDTNDFSTDEIGAASDVVLTTWSTEGLHGIYRRKPTAHITDTNFRIHESLELPLAPVKLGASVGVNKVSDITDVLTQLLNPDSVLNQRLKLKMTEQYPADGKNTERVANIVREYLK